jgi:hypothetical protein
MEANDAFGEQGMDWMNRLDSKKKVRAQASDFGSEYGARMLKIHEGGGQLKGPKEQPKVWK